MIDFAGMASCEVSYLDTDGVRHKVEVEAGSLYEAAVLGLRVFKRHDCQPGPMRSLEIEIRSAVVHAITVQKVHDWLKGGARTPKDAVMKDRLRSMLEE
jgi:hypothetical protein